MAHRIPDTITRGGLYAFKKRVPADLVDTQPFGGRKFIQVSLGTRNRGDALRRAQRERDRFDTMVAQAKRSLAAPPGAAELAGRIEIVPTADMFLSVAQDYRASFVAAHPSHLDHKYEWEFGHIAPEWVGGKPLSDWLVIRDELESPKPPADIVELAGRLAQRHKWKLEPRSDEFLRFCEILASAKLSGVKTILARREGDGFDLLIKSQTDLPGFEAYTLRDAVTDYISAKPARSHMITKMTAALRAWTQLVGVAPISAIKPPTVYTYIDRLLLTPTRASERFRGLPLPQAIEANEGRPEPYPTLSPKTVKEGYVTPLTSAVSEAVKRGKTASNPFRDIKVDKSDEPNEAIRHFRSNELSLIFRHPTWSGCKSKARRNTPGNRLIRDHYYWAPLVALFTGMRASEIAALRHCDISLPGDSSPWPHFAVKGTKTANAVRSIPFHPVLTKLGFEDYVRGSKDGDQRRRIFPGWSRPKGKAYSSAGCIRNFNQKVLAHPELDKEDLKLSFHCFRHTLEREMARGRLNTEWRDTILGHSLKNMRRHYSKPDLSDYHGPFCEAVEFAELDLHHLFSANEERTNV